MWEFIVFLKRQFSNIANVLDEVVFLNFDGLDVSLLELLVGFILLGLVISVFWKGART